MFLAGGVQIETVILVNDIIINLNVSNFLICKIIVLNPWWPGDSNSKESARNVGDPSSIPGVGRSPGEENGNALQYSCLENAMDRGAWRATVRKVAKSPTWLRLHFHFLGFPDSSVGKEFACNAGDPGSIPGLGRSLREGKGYPLQYSGLENSIESMGSQRARHD